MKNVKYLIVAILAISFTFCLTGCNKDDDRIVNDDLSGTKVKITFGSSEYIATLYDNATAAAFISMLPLTLNMNEHGGIEKVAGLPSNPPSNHSNPGTIQSGDLMLYSSNSLVLFYTTHNTSYSYTRIGRLDNPAGLASALGSGSVAVTFELE